MRALHTALVLETGRAPIPARAARAERVESDAMFKNMALFLSAPFIGLVYAILLPFVGLGMLAWFATRGLYEWGKAHQLLRTGKKMLLCSVAPVAGLVYLIALPFAGLGALGWFAAKAIMASTPA